MSSLSQSDALVFRTHRGKMLTFAAILGLFAWLGVNRGGGDMFWEIFWVALGTLLTLLGVFVVFLAFRREPLLVLGNEGFTLTSWIKTRLFRWPECYDFHVRRFVGVDVIYFRRQGYAGDCAIMNLYDAPTDSIVRAMDQRSRNARDAA